MSGESEHGNTEGGLQFSALKAPSRCNNNAFFAWLHLCYAHFVHEFLLKKSSEDTLEMACARNHLRHMTQALLIEAGW